MFELHTEIEINAPAERVWSVIEDFSAYPQWNPFIRHIHGAAKQGEALEVRIQPSGGKEMTFRPTVLVSEPSRELRWIGRFLMPGIFDGEHRFVIEPLSEGKVRFEHAERFRGILVPLLRRSLDRDTRRGFTEMNTALKERAENQ